MNILTKKIGLCNIEANVTHILPKEVFTLPIKDAFYYMS